MNTWRSLKQMKPPPSAPDHCHLLNSDFIRLISACSDVHNKKRMTSRLPRFDLVIYLVLKCITLGSEPAFSASSFCAHGNSNISAPSDAFIIDRRGQRRVEFVTLSGETDESEMQTPKLRRIWNKYSPSVCEEPELCCSTATAFKVLRF